MVQNSQKFSYGFPILKFQKGYFFGTPFFTIADTILSIKLLHPHLIAILVIITLAITKIISINKFLFLAGM